MNTSSNKFVMRDRPGEAKSPKPTAVFSGSSRADVFYQECLRLLCESGIPYLVGGTLAVSIYTGLPPPQKDVDVFCKGGDDPRILAHFQRHGFDTEVEDERWIAKIKRGDLFLDVIFNSTTAIIPVTAEWLAHAVSTDVRSEPARATVARPSESEGRRRKRLS